MGRVKGRRDGWLDGHRPCRFAGAGENEGDGEAKGGWKRCVRAFSFSFCFITIIACPDNK